MNIVLIEPEEIAAPGLARVGGRKARHLYRVLGKEPGQGVRIGVLGGRLGQGVIERLTVTEAWIRYEATEDPPVASPIKLVLALPRPPMLRRILGHLTALGVKDVVLLHTARVEKSFWDSHSMRPEAIRDQLLLGLEQARDTIVPRVELRRRFLPFVEDELSDWSGEGRRVLAAPRPDAPELNGVSGLTTAVVGPEGGFIPFEGERLMSAGFEAMSLGPRILRVETAVVAVVARLSEPGGDRRAMR